MSWKRIKTFLIILFAVINIYLILSTGGIRFRSVTEFDEKNINKTVDVIEKNFSVTIDKKLIPREIDNLKVIDVDNILFSKSFRDNNNITETGHGFKVTYKTNTASYTENTAMTEMKSLLQRYGIDEGTYKIKFNMSDEGLLCSVYQYVKSYPVFNGKISALFSSNKIAVSGQWYIPKTNDVKSKDTSLKMADLSGVLLDVSSSSTENKDLSFNKITYFDYGYYVSSYDESVISKTATAVPCYMFKTDIGSIYYYDAENGILLKQEE